MVLPLGWRREPAAEKGNQELRCEPQSDPRFLPMKEFVVYLLHVPEGRKRRWGRQKGSWGWGWRQTGGERGSSILWDLDVGGFCRRGVHRARTCTWDQQLRAHLGLAHLAFTNKIRTLVFKGHLWEPHMVSACLPWGRFKEGEVLGLIFLHWVGRVDGEEGWWWGLCPLEYPHSTLVLCEVSGHSHGHVWKRSALKSWTLRCSFSWNSLHSSCQLQGSLPPTRFASPNWVDSFNFTFKSQGLSWVPRSLSRLHVGICVGSYVLKLSASNSGSPGGFPTDLSFPAFVDLAVPIHFKKFFMG